MWHSEDAASGPFCSSGSVLTVHTSCSCRGQDGGHSRLPLPKTGLQEEERTQEQLRHTKKRAWPFLFNLRIFPRRCLAVAIPFFGRLPFVAWLLIGGGFDAGLLVG